ncbi:hypothetical protein GCM10023115_32320 [Pontixanthobacter gangjinensis]|uniref:hypothetical protein n=1 Tax=Christiangramia aestuarii TaxID=1028746 RepID=UPI0012E14BF6|nr:hypothetical protein [Christiangramia aestuarii]
MKIKIKSRDVKFFFLGIIAALVFSFVYDWEDNLASLKRGYEDGQKAYDISREQK